MQLSNSDPSSPSSKFLLPAIALLLLATFPISAKAECGTFFGNEFKKSYVNESGQFITDWEQRTFLNKDESGWSSITIQENYMKPFFEVTDTGTDFVLKVGVTFPHCKRILFPGFQFK